MTLSMENKLFDLIKNRYKINCSLNVPLNSKNRMPGIMSLQLHSSEPIGVEVVAELAFKNIAVSSGSACNVRASEDSYADSPLSSQLSLSPKEIQNTIRISSSYIEENIEEDMELLAGQLKDAIDSVTESID